jgi:Co/Zn/Cd efflux system component
MRDKHDQAGDARLRRTVAAVAVLNLAYFGVEATVASLIHSVALFADSVDFLEDATVNILVLVALGWSAARRRLVGLLLACILLLPGFAALWTAWEKLGTPVAPDAFTLTLAGLGALAVNFTCALLLARVRLAGGSLTRAAYLSARNDVLANVGIIAAGFATAWTHSHLPDLVVGLAIAAVNAGAAYEVYEAAMGETDEDDDGDGKVRARA